MLQFRWSVICLGMMALGIWCGTVGGGEKGDGFALHHDSEKYGEFLPVQRVEGSLPTSDVTLQGNWLYAVGRDNITIYDVSVPAQPVEVSRLIGIGEGRQVAFYKDHLYVTARTGGLYVVDVSDPHIPRLRAHYDTMELATGICCVDDVAYISQRQFGTEFVDISNPSNPRHLGFVISGEAQSVDCLNGILYAGDWGVSELTLIDVRNPKNAQIIGKGKLDGLGDGVYIRDSICYAATGPKKLKTVPSEGHGLDIFSVANPREPKLLGRLKFPAQAIHKFPDFWSVSVNEAKMAFVADSYNGVFCVDVSDPQNPRGAGYAILPVWEKTGNPDPVAAVECGNGVLYVAGTQNGVYVVEAPGIARPISPHREGPRLEAPILPDNVMSEALRNDFSILPTEGQALAAAFWKENLVWVAAGTEGLLLVDVGGEEPKVRNVYPTSGFVYDVCVHGNRLYVAEGKRGVGIYTLGDNGQRKILGRVESGETVRQIVIPLKDRLLVTKEGNARLRFLDISEPQCPKLLFTDHMPKGILYGRDLVEGISEQGLMVCVAQESGLIWYDLSGVIPERKTISFPGEVSFAHGACWKDGRLCYFRKGSLYTCDAAETRRLEDVPKGDIPGLSNFGKAVSHGNQVCFTDRRMGKIFFLEFSEGEAPQIVRAYSLHGHPELAVWVGDRVVIPCGHAGLLVERKKDVE